MKIPPNLLKALREFDGKSTFSLETAVAQLDEKSLNESLIELVKSNTQVPTDALSWLIKYTAEKSDNIPDAIVNATYRILLNANDWQSVLHALQLFEKFSLWTQPKNKTQQDTLFRRLLWLIDIENKFVKAWAYNALVVVAFRLPKYQGDIEPVILVAQKHESGAVAARLRQALKRYPITTNDRAN